MVLFLLIFLIILLLAYLLRVLQLSGNSPNSLIVFPLIVGIAFTAVAEYRWNSGESQGSHLVKYASDTSNSELQCQKMFESFFDYDQTDKSGIDKNEPNTVRMNYEPCEALIEWINSDKSDRSATSEQAFALHLLIFQSNRIDNLNKVEAECEASEKFVKVATYAGASVSEAERMLEVYQSDWYPLLSEDIKSDCG